VTDYDVIVVGGGPAGATAARALASRGVDVALLEKERLPRRKACAGAVSVRTLQHLDARLDEVTLDRFDGVAFAFDAADAIAVRVPEPYAYSVDRAAFDKRLVDLAVGAGAELMEGTPALDAGAEAGVAWVETPGGRLASYLLIGADGVPSRVARGCGLAQGMRVASAVEAVVPRSMARRDARAYGGIGRLAELEGVALVDLGCASGGYGWIFPKADRFSVGVGSFRRACGSLRASFDRYFDAYFVRGSGRRGDGPELIGHALPLGGSRIRIADRRCLLAGDAAGLCDPLFGEGIYYAVRSGLLAAEAAYEALSGDADALERYERRVEDEIRRPMRIAAALSRVLYAIPGFSHRYVLKKREAIKAFLEVVAGTRSYASLRAWLLRRFPYEVLRPLHGWLRPESRRPGRI